MEKDKFELLKTEASNLFKRLRGGNITVEQYEELMEILNRIHASILIPASTLDREKSK